MCLAAPPSEAPTAHETSPSGNSPTAIVRSFPVLEPFVVSRTTDQAGLGNIFSPRHAARDRHQPREMFVGFSSDQFRLTWMLESMAEVHDGVREVLTEFISPRPGPCYFIPSLAALPSILAEEPAG